MTNWVERTRPEVKEMPETEHKMDTRRPGKCSAKASRNWNACTRPLQLFGGVQSPRPDADLLENNTPNSYDLKKAAGYSTTITTACRRSRNGFLNAAVLKLKGDIKSYFCFLSPSIGKTSLGKSIAAAVNRKCVTGEHWAVLHGE